MSEAVKSRDAWGAIWDKFNEDRREGRATAFTNLQRSLAENSRELVPSYYTAKEFGQAIIEFEEYTKGDKQSESGNPLDAMSDWLSGKVDLSRIPLETRKIQ